MRKYLSSRTRYTESNQEIEMFSGKIKSCIVGLKRVAEELDLDLMTISHLGRVEEALESFTREASGEIEQAEEERKKNEMA